MSTEHLIFFKMNIPFIRHVLIECKDKKLEAPFMKNWEIFVKEKQEKTE